MKLHYFLIPIMMVLTTCSNKEESEVLEMATDFFDKLEKRQYDSIYVLLSFNDRKNMTQNDFVAFCQGWNLNPYEMDGIAGDTIIIGESDDNAFLATKRFFATNQEKVRQLKYEDESYEEAIKRLAGQNLLPLKSDSSFIKIIREGTSLKVDLSLKYFKAYDSIWSNYMDSLNKLVEVVPVKISLENIGTFWIVKAEVKIMNHSNYDVKYLTVEMIYEKQIIGRFDLSPYPNSFAPDSLFIKKTSVDLNQMPKLKKYISNKIRVLNNSDVELNVTAGFPEDFKLIENEIAKRSNFYAFSMFPMSKR